MVRRWVILLIIIAVIAGGGLTWWNFVAQRQEPGNGPGDAVFRVAKGLDVPWSLDFLPDGSMVITERPGRVRRVDPEGRLDPEPVLTIDAVLAQGEGGLLGVAVHPDFNDNGYVYFYYTYDDGGPHNRVVRYTWRDGAPAGEEIILAGIPGGSIHNGGRIKFGPDGLLYITAGDAGDSANAQDLDSLAGKILRVTGEGAVPADNPFPGSPVYSYGHRNPQGLAWDENGALWETEHGQSATDELNIIEPGKNYGWPAIRGGETRAGMVTPVTNSGSDTWAPSGTAWYRGSVFWAGLRGQSLFRYSAAGLESSFNRDFGRLRDVVVRPDGTAYLLTNNRDGRGIPGPDDDQVIRIDLEALLAKP